MGCSGVFCYVFDGGGGGGWWMVLYYFFIMVVVYFLIGMWIFCVRKI